MNNETNIIKAVNKPKRKSPLVFRRSMPFVKIDRKKEDKDVFAFQVSQDVDILEKIYHRRIPSLQIMARKYKYLTHGDENDMFAELTYHFIKAVNGFDHTRGTFNTFLFTSLLYFIRNKYSSIKAKKRNPFGADVNNYSNFMLSLDYSCEGNSDTTLKDTLPCLSEEIKENVRLQESISILSNGDSHTMYFLNKLSAGATIASLIKEMKTKQGRIKLNSVQSKKIDLQSSSHNDIADIIKDNISTNEDFHLIDYQIKNPNKLHYTIEMKKTQEVDAMMKTIREFRKNKNKLIKKIYG